MISRRKLIAGLIAAPAIVRVSSLMPIRGIIMDVSQKGFAPIGFIVRYNKLIQNDILNDMERSLWRIIERR